MAYGLTQSAHLVAASSQSFTHADTAVLEVVNGWTVEMWFKTTSSGTMRLAYSRNGENGWGITMGQATAGKISLNAGSGVFGGSSETTSTYNDGNWHFVRAYFNGSSSIIYVDGTQYNVTGNPDIATSSTTVAFGQDNRSSTGFFDGQLSLIRIWNNQHTTADSCTVYGTATANMNAEWSLNNVVTDASGNGNTLTNNGSTTFTSDVPAICVSSGSTNILRSFNLLGVGQ